jgi:hypothetical protein
MVPMLRRLLKVLSGLSLLLCVATTGSACIGFGTVRVGGHELTSNVGALEWSVGYDCIAVSQWSGPGLSVTHWKSGGRALAINAWLLALAFSLLPLARWRSQRDQPRVGYCGACGYDLRATPGRCPECGTSVAAKDA